MCLKCVERYCLSKGVAEKLGLVDRQGDPVELVRGRGCRSCFQSGYAGREVIAETLVMTPEVRDLIIKKAPEREIENIARNQGMKTLREQALAKVTAHLTSLDEVFRTTIGEVVEG